MIIPSNFTSDEINNLQESINLDYLITSWSKLNNIKNNTIPTFPIEELSPGMGGCAPSRSTQFKDNQIVCLLLTSGTTGLPKIVQISFKNIIKSCDSWNKQISFTEKDSYLCCLPLHHIGGLAIIFRALSDSRRFKIFAIDSLESKIKTSV